MISDIESTFDSDEVNEDVKIKISEQIICLLPRAKSKKFDIVKKALIEIKKYYKEIFNKNVYQKEVDITASLDYGIFFAFYPR